MPAASTVSPSSIVSTVLVLAVCLWFVRPRIQGNLRGYPGPFLASKLLQEAEWTQSTENLEQGCTDLWRLYHVWRGNSHLVVKQLHDKYRLVVRIGPNVLDLDFPELAKKIYNIKGDWLKVLTLHKL